MPKFKEGDLVMWLIDEANDARVLKGDVGVIVIPDYPLTGWCEVRPLHPRPPHPRFLNQVTRPVWHAHRCDLQLAYGLARLLYG